MISVLFKHAFFLLLVLALSSCGAIERRRKSMRPPPISSPERQRLADMGASSVFVHLSARDFSGGDKCRALGRMKIISSNLREGQLEQGLEELRQQAFLKGADHAVVLDYTNDLLYAELYFCASDYSDYKK